MAAAKQVYVYTPDARWAVEGTPKAICDAIDTAGKWWKVPGRTDLYLHTNQITAVRRVGANG